MRILLLMSVGISLLSMSNLFSRNESYQFTNPKDAVSTIDSPIVSCNGALLKDLVYMGEYGFVVRKGPQAKFSVYTNPPGYAKLYWVQVRPFTKTTDDCADLYSLTEEMKNDEWVKTNRWTHYMNYDGYTWYVNMNERL